MRIDISYEEANEALCAHARKKLNIPEETPIKCILRGGRITKGTRTNGHVELYVGEDAGKIDPGSVSISAEDMLKQTTSTEQPIVENTTSEETQAPIFDSSSDEESSTNY